VIILTDIHGNFNTMMALLDKIPQEEKDKGIVICGDLVDRGPRSRQIVQWCIDNNIQVVKGNHEVMMVDDAMKEASYYKKNYTFDYFGSGGAWVVNGGFETLESYIDTDEDGRKDINILALHEHIMWMDKLPLYIEFRNIKNEDGRYLVISHSNITNQWKDRDSQDKNRLKYFENAVLWGRPHKIKDVPEIFNVIGHTPQQNGPRIRKTYANIDTGCFYKGEPGYYRLTALQYPEMIVYEQENIDMVRPKSVFEELDEEND